MSFVLRNNESVVAQAKFHWASFLIPGIWALFFTGPVIGALGQADLPKFIVVAVAAFAYAPLLHRFLANKTNKFIITNQRLYLEMGILSKNLIELPIAKIQDVSFRQNFSQRILGTGSLVVLTGNDKATVVPNIDDAISFREKLAQMTVKVSA